MAGVGFILRRFESVQTILLDTDLPHLAPHNFNYIYFNWLKEDADDS